MDNSGFRKEHDTMGEVLVPADKYWGAQTQRSYMNFRIGTEKMPEEIIRAFAILKKAAALANVRLGMLDSLRAETIAGVCDEILEKLDILYLKDKLYSEISGGEQQMTLIARALVQEPEFIMMDEPTSNLDYGNQIQVLKRVVELKNSGKGVVMITHSPDQAFLCADEAVLFFRDGSVVSGEVRDVLTEENISRLYGVEIEIDTGKNRDGAASAWCRPGSR